MICQKMDRMWCKIILQLLYISSDLSHGIILHAILGTQQRNGFEEYLSPHSEPLNWQIYK